MEHEIKAGLKGEADTQVDNTNMATAYGVEGVEVFATPALVALVEQAAHNAVKDFLPSGYTTVGAEIKLKHLTPTPPGMQVQAEATVVQVEGRKLIFSIKAQDEKEQTAVGQHRRFIVNLEKFIGKQK